MSKRHLSVIFCDDVRQEVGGKLTLVGCYGPEMLSESLPIVLPKLCVTMSLETLVSEPLTSLAFAVVDETGFEHARVDLNEGELSKFALTIPNGDEAKNSMYAMNAIVQLSPFVAEKPMKLRTVAYTESGEVRGRPLKIRQATAEELQNLR